MQKKEIIINSKDVKKIFYIFFIPLFITFLIEHFSEFHYTTRISSESMADVQATDLNFITPFGSEIYEDVSNKNLKYEIHNDGLARINGYYSGRFPYYLKGVFKDILYPLSVSFVFLIVFIFARKFRVRITNK